MRAILVTLLVCAALYAVAVLGMQRRLIYPRPPAPDRPPALLGLERWRVGPDAVEAWFLPPLGDAAGRPHPTVVFGHGNGELIDHWADAFQPPRSWGVGVLLVEYPGYGRSGGTPSEASIGRAFRAAYDRLLQREHVDPQRVVGYGRSLGGGAVCGLAAQRPLAALVLESTFTSLVPLAAGLLVPPPLVLDRYDNRAVVARFPRPILLLHGARDTIIPASHARGLHDAAPDARLHLLPCGHNDCPRPWDRIRAFLAEAGVL